MVPKQWQNPSKFRKNTKGEKMEEKSTKWNSKQEGSQMDPQKIKKSLLTCKSGEEQKR